VRRYTVEGEDLFTTLNPIICRTTLIGGVGTIEGMITNTTITTNFVVKSFVDNEVLETFAFFEDAEDYASRLRPTPKIYQRKTTIDEVLAQ
jgi:hypothetical protein